MSAHRCLKCPTDKKPDVWSWYPWLPQPGEPKGSRYWVLCESHEEELLKSAFEKAGAALADKPVVNFPEDLLGECRECNRLLRDCGQHAAEKPAAGGACPKCWGPIEANRDLCQQCHDAEAIGTPGEKAGNPWAPNRDYPGKPIADKPASDEVRKERARCAAILDQEGRRAMDSGATELAGVFWSLEAKIKQGDPVDGPEKTRERA